MELALIFIGAFAVFVIIRQVSKNRKAKSTSTGGTRKDDEVRPNKN